MTSGRWARELLLGCAIATLVALALIRLAAPEPVIDDAAARAGGQTASSPSLDSRSPLADPSPTAPPSKRPGREEATTEPDVVNGTGELAVVPGSSPVLGEGTPLTFIVEVEQGLQVDGAAFAAEVERVLGSPRSWGPSDGVSFRRVDAGEPAFRVALAGPALTDRLCFPLLTNGIFSCEMGGRVVLNYWRWVEGAEAYGNDIANYRIYMINHEVGHALGHGHEVCPVAGAPAPVMVQQTKGVGACKPNPWPNP